MPLKPEVVGKRLKETRHAAGLTSTRKASETTGFPVSEDTLIGWESRGTDPRAFLLSKVCDFYSAILRARDEKDEDEDDRFAHGVAVAYILGYVDHPSGYPVLKSVIDIRADQRVKDARSLEEIDDLIIRCPVCNSVDVDVAFEFPEHFLPTSGAAAMKAGKRACLKLAELVKRSESGGE